MKLWRGLSADGQTITIRKFDGSFVIPPFVNPDWIEANRDQICRAAVVDTETTGLNPATDRVIEIAVRTFRFHKKSGHLVSMEEAYSALQDPGQPLSQETIHITGLTDDEVRGKSIDWIRVKELLVPCEIIIAHNAAFDRQFVENELGEGLKNVWGCSFKDIEWAEKGFGIQKLELLSAYHGFFTDAHRALNDVDALLNLLIQPDMKTGTPYLAELYVNAHRPRTKVLAAGSPFESKDLLKRRGYRWDKDIRSWNKVIFADELAVEIQWLEQEVYRGRFLGKTQALEPSAVE